MKKILSMLIVSVLILSLAVGCASKVKQESLDAIAKSYASNSYEEREQKEIDALVAEYSQKIEEAKSDDEVNKLKEEAIAKIGEVYSKEKIESIKADAEEALNALKGKILPYQKLREILPKVKELLSSDKYAEMEAAVNELKEFAAGISERAVLDHDQDGLKFSVEAVYSEEDGIPVVTYTFNDTYKNFGLTDEQMMTVSMSTICHSSVLNPQVDKMLSYNGIMFTNQFAAYCGDEGKYFVETHELARCEVNENTYQFKICTPEQKDILFSDSETFFNSDGVETKRDSGEENAVNYVTILEQDPSNVETGNSLADRLTWIIIL